MVPAFLQKRRSGKPMLRIAVLAISLLTIGLLLAFAIPMVITDRLLTKVDKLATITGTLIFTLLGLGLIDRLRR